MFFFVKNVPSIFLFFSIFLYIYIYIYKKRGSLFILQLAARAAGRAP